MIPPNQWGYGFLIYIVFLFGNYLLFGESIRKHQLTNTPKDYKECADLCRQRCMIYFRNGSITLQEAPKCLEEQLQKKCSKYEDFHKLQSCQKEQVEWCQANASKSD